MSTIGLDKPYYAVITEDSTTGEETYGTPVSMAKAISADIAVQAAEAALYADDALDEAVREFTSGTITLNVNDLYENVKEALLGNKVDANGVLVSASEDTSPLVAVGFRAKKANGKYRYFWLYRVRFGEPDTNLQTKGESVSFQTPTIVGTLMRRNKADVYGHHPWKTEVTDGVSGVTASVITGWFSSVYEPSNTTPTPGP